MSTQASLQAQVQQLQSSLSQAQQELQESHLELEACRRGEMYTHKMHSISAYRLHLVQLGCQILNSN